MEWHLNNDDDTAPRFWKRQGDFIELDENYDSDDIDYQFEFTPSTDDISDVYAFDRCTFKIWARNDDDTYFDPATDDQDAVDILDESKREEAGNFYINFKGFLFQGEYTDGNNNYAGLPEEMLVMGHPVVSFDAHNNIAQIMSKKNTDNL